MLPLSEALFSTWMDALLQYFPVYACVCFICLALLHMHFRVISYVETNTHGRALVRLDDPLHKIVPATDLSSWISGGLNAAVTTLLLHEYSCALPVGGGPRMCMLAVSYTWAITLKTGMVWLTPLEAPEGFVPLRDPVLDILLRILEGAGGCGAEHRKRQRALPTRDLFFSGHTATMWLCFFSVSEGEWSQLIRFLLFGLAVVVSVCLVLQRIHYSVDVVVGVVIARYVVLELAAQGLV